MATLPGLDSDIYFGGVDTPLPDWRDIPSPFDDDDDDAPADPGLIAILGLDPDDLDWDGEDDGEVEALRES